MLEVIKKNRLSDTSLVVTRYFGGIKLGGGGLIRAYGKSASEAVRAAGTVERILHTRIGIEISYNLLGPLENQLRNQGYNIVDKQFTDKIRLCVLAESGNEDTLRKFVTDIAAGDAAFSAEGFEYVEKDLPCSL